MIKKSVRKPLFEKSSEIKVNKKVEKQPDGNETKKDLKELNLIKELSII